MTQITELKAKRVLVIGFGRQGRALAQWLPTQGASVIVSDGRSAEQLQLNGDDYPAVTFQLNDAQDTLPDNIDLVCLSGGVPLDSPLVVQAQAQTIPLSNDAQLFLERCPAPVVGITGSAGKTTTTMLTGEILRHAGYTTWIGGNIGDVLLTKLDQIEREHVVVMELSSFQLEIMTVGPRVGTVLNITPNHLDRHGDMETYTHAKVQILAHQSADDIAVLCRDDARSRALEDTVAGELVWYSAREMVADGAFLAGSRLIVSGLSSADGNPHIIGEKSEILLRGEHNVLNTLAALAITGALGVRPDDMMATVRTFRGVPHRLEVVRELDGVVYINDSIATAPERVEAGLKSFTEPLIVLLGGYDKDLPWDNVLELAAKRARHIIAFGKPGDKSVASLVTKRLRDFHIDEAYFSQVETLDEAVALAAQLAEPGFMVLLSPGGTSFDAYADFAARGAHFRELVNGL